MIQALAKLLKVLNSETEPAQISLAFCFAMVVGFTPFFSLHNLLVILFVLVLRVNLSAFLLAFVFSAGIAYLLDPLFHQIGLAILHAEGLQSLWVALYDQAFWRIVRFNNTLVMGSFISALILFVPLLLLSNRLIRKYRETFLVWIGETRFMKAFRASKLYGAYETLSDWKGES